LTAPVWLEARHLSCTLSGRQILADISLQIPAGQLTTLTGPNGVGKSTLLRLLSGYLSPDQGEVILAGQPLTRWPLKIRAHHLAVVTSREIPPAFAFSVKDYVALGRSPYQDWLGSVRSRDQEQVSQALERVGLTAQQKQDVRALSSGEWQRAQLARALAQESAGLLLDEPTAHLDIGAEVEMLHLLRELSRSGLAIFAILHDLSLAAHFGDQLLLLHQGRLRASGTAHEVLRPELLSEIYGPYWEIGESVSGHPILHPCYEGHSS
jgi:iron complex transport system ATP-binding protein